MRGDHVQAGPQPKVKGVAEDDLGAELAQFMRRHRLDGAIGADRHERRRIECAVSEHDAPAARGAVARQDVEFHVRHRSSSIASP
jgi:hypothetical protein